MALTANLGSNQAGKFGSIRRWKVGSVKIWRGATVALRTDGLAYPAVEDTTDTYKQQVVGWSLEEGPIDGYVRTRADGQFMRKFPGVTQAAIGRLALVKDDETVHTYSGGAGKVVSGRIVSIYTESAEVFVDFTDKPLRLASSLYD